MATKFRGIYIPLITAFHDDGEVDYKATEDVVEFMINAGVHGFFVLGSTGMGPVMTTQQRIETAEFVVKRINRRRPVILHVGTADYQTTMQLAQHGDKLGVDAIGIVPPYYFSDHTSWEIFEHYKGVAKAISSPIFLYDNEKYYGFKFTPELAKKLKEEVPSLCGMKASYYPQALLLAYLGAMPKDFSVFSGNTIDLFPATPQGLCGAIPPPTAHIPEVIVALWNALEAKKYDEAAALQKKADDYGRTVVRLGMRFGRTVHRDAFRLRGLNVKRYPRWPAEELSAEATATLTAALKATGVTSR